MAIEDAPWPYDLVPPSAPEVGVPTWECPKGICECHPVEGEREPVEHVITLFDAKARKMPGARCRVFEDGKQINLSQPFADEAACIRFDVDPRTKHLAIQWAPKELPLEASYPYQRFYHRDLGKTPREGVTRRLGNLGFSHHGLLDDNVRDYQRAYRRPSTGRFQDIETELAVFHDEGTLPPLPDPPEEGADDEAGRASGSGKNQLVQAQLDDAPVARAIPGAGSPGSGGTKPKGSAAQVLLILVRVRVRTRGGRPLANAEVTVDAGATPRVLRTDKAGFAKLTLVEDDFGITMPRTFVTIEVMVRHHGPDPGGNDVKTKRFHASVAVDQRALRPQSEQTLLVPDASTPGIVEDPKGRFLDVVMMDAGMNRRGLAVGIPTRRLTDDQVLDEMIFHYVSGDLPLDAASEPQFDHDPASGDLDPCTDACKLRKPKTTDRVGLLEAVVAGVTFLHFMNTAVSQPKKGDLPGERYTRERISWKRETLNMLDQRQAVGVTRLCHHLRLFHDIAAIYNVGISGDQGRADCHGHGLAIDFSGCAKALPGTVLKSEATTTTDVRMGTDFIVFLHWGRVPMWDPKTVAANPADSSKWVRLPDQFPFDDLTNFETVNPKIKKLHYRLDPAPFQPAPGTTPSELEASIAGHFAEARVLFRRIYQFFVDEYSDGNDVLGPNAPPDVPTELDGHDGHFIIHPDYAEPNASAGAKSGREAHNNHLHAQLGKTNYPAARFP